MALKVASVIVVAPTIASARQIGWGFFCGDIFCRDNLALIPSVISHGLRREPLREMDTKFLVESNIFRKKIRGEQTTEGGETLTGSFSFLLCSVLIDASSSCALLLL
jgi:hypothetical protein